jgi:polyhydroxybutyrate depolymerase
MRHRAALLLGLSFLVLHCKSKPAAPLPAPPSEAHTAEPSAKAPPLTTTPTTLPRLETELHLPSDVKQGERLPLMLVLHGLGASSETLARGTDWPRFLEAQRVAWLMPDGPKDRSGRRFWDAGPSCCNLDQLPVDHVEQFRELITRTLRENPIDPERVFVAGYSNGGFMAHRLGCELRPLIRGIVSISGVGQSNASPCPPGPPLRVLQIHGTDDDIVAYAGGHLFGKDSYPEHVSAEKTISDWAARLGCGQPAPEETLDFEAKLADKETNVKRFGQCSGGRVELWTVAAGSHYIGFRSPSQEAIWRFLNR